MRVSVIAIHEHNRPHSADVILVEDINGGQYYLLDSDIEKMLVEQGDLCEHCLGEDPRCEFCSDEDFSGATEQDR